MSKSKSKIKALAETHHIEPTANISPLVTLAMNGKIDVDKLDKLITVQERYEENLAKKEFYKAFSEFKKNDITITKDSTVSYGQTSYKHASLSNVMNIVSPLLAEQGLAISWIPKQENNNVSVTAILSHVLGYSVDSTLSAPPDDSGKKNSIQAVASTNTYLQRYTVLAILGLATSEDNDGATPPGEVEYITDDQVESLQFLISKTGREETELTKAVCDAYKIPSLGHIYTKDYAAISDRIVKSKT